MSKWSKAYSVPAGMENDSEDSEDDSFLFESCEKSSRHERNSPEYHDGKCSDENPALSYDCLASSKSEPASEEKSALKKGPAMTAPKNDVNESCIDNDRVGPQIMISPKALPLDDFRLAVVLGNLDAVKTVIEKDCPVDVILKSGWTALMFACSCGQPEVARYLLEKNADANFHKDRFTPLMAACASSSDAEVQLVKCVEYLIAYGADVNSYERHHVTALMFAAREGHQKIAKKLLEQTINIDAVDNQGWTALTWAVSRGHGMIVKTLLEKDASMKPLNQGQSLLDFAYYREQIDIAEMLERFAKDKTLPLNLNSPVEKRHQEAFQQKKVEPTYSGDLEMFLTGLQLPHLIPVFHSHELSFADILKLNDADLVKIGICKLGVRKKLLAGIHDVHLKEWRDSSVPKLSKVFSCPDAVCVVANIAQHLSYIRSTIGYIRSQLQAEPKILELCQDVNNVHSLVKRLEEAMISSKNLHGEMHFLKLHLDKVKGNVEYVPGDIIIEKQNAVSALRQRRGSILAFTAACVIGVAVASKWIRMPIIIDKMCGWHL